MPTLAGFDRVSGAVRRAGDASLELEDRKIEEQERVRDNNIQDEEIARKKKLDELDLEIRKDEVDILDRSKKGRQLAAESSEDTVKNELKINELKVKEAEESLLEKQLAVKKLSASIGSQNSARLLELGSAISAGTDPQELVGQMSQLTGQQIKTAKRTADGGLSIVAADGEDFNIPGSMINNAAFSKFVKNSGGLMNLGKGQVGFFDPRKFAAGDPSPVTIVSPEASKRLQKTVLETQQIINKFINKDKLAVKEFKDLSETSGNEWAAEAANIAADVLSFYPQVALLGERKIVTAATSFAQNRTPLSQMSDVEKSRVVNEYRSIVAAEVLSEAMGFPISPDDINGLTKDVNGPVNKPEEPLSLQDKLKQAQSQSNQSELSLATEALGEGLMDLTVGGINAAQKVPGAVGAGANELFNSTADMHSVLSGDIKFEDLSEDSSLKKMIKRFSKAASKSGALKNAAPNLFLNLIGL